MIKQLLLIIIISFWSFCLCYGQANNQTDKYNFDKDCNEGNLNQQEINICLGKALDNLNKIMSEKYKCLISSLDTAIKIYSINDTALASTYKRLKKIVVNSQTSWEKLENQNVSLYLSYYNEGTDRPMFYAMSKIQDVKDRLRRLDDFVDTLEQDRIINCK